MRKLYVTPVWLRFYTHFLCIYTPFNITVLLHVESMWFFFRLIYNQKYVCINNTQMEWIGYVMNTLLTILPHALTLFPSIYNLACRSIGIKLLYVIFLNK